MLEIAHLSASYGGIAAVRDASISVPKGMMVALIGPNGAGKTSLLNTVSGFLKPKSGSVQLDGEDMTGQAAHRIARAGLIQVPEGRQVLAPMTVAENLDLGRFASGRRGSAASDLDRVYQLFPLLAERRRQLAGSLSGGQQQMLAIGRALLGRPRVLLLDEPSLGLSPIMASQVFAGLVTLNREGLTILLVEQNAKRALAATERAYVIERGLVVHEGKSCELAKDPIVIEHYLGCA